jgi:hypothetical protein
MQLGGAAPDCVAQVFERVFAVAAHVHRDHQAAAAPHQFIDAQVVEVTAIAQVHVARVGIQLAEQLGQQAEEADGRG